MKSHSPIQAPSGGKTLEEAENKFKKEYRGWINEIELNSAWEWFESTLSFLTEQMIPEEVNEPGYDWNGAIEEMKKRREEILK